MKNLLPMLALLISSLVFANDHFATVPGSELDIGGVRIGQSESQVIDKLGRPKAIESNDEGRVFHYEGLDVAIGEGEYGVFDITGTGKSACTPKAICPGMSVASLSDTYGVPIIAARPEGEYLEYHGSETTCWLQISVDRTVIRSMRIACQP